MAAQLQIRPVVVRAVAVIIERIALFALRWPFRANVTGASVCVPPAPAETARGPHPFVDHVVAIVVLVVADLRRSWIDGRIAIFAIVVAKSEAFADAAPDLGEPAGHAMTIAVFVLAKRGGVQTFVDGAIAVVVFSVAELRRLLGGRRPRRGKQRWKW